MRHYFSISLFLYFSFSHFLNPEVEQLYYLSIGILISFSTDLSIKLTKKNNNKKYQLVYVSFRN